ncbi:MAG TPA: hypothetical protein VJ599_09550 [Nitrososphaeraceae archaeon]|nr:hypothetical protein [Nitrososphaeraceae archaeon]
MTGPKRCDICSRVQGTDDAESPGPWSEISLGHYKNVNFRFICGYCTEWLIEILERLKNKKNTDSVTEVWDDVETKVSME